MKKIGIITFHRAHNAGAMLQAVALQNFLDGTGKYNAVILDYRNTRIESQYYPRRNIKFYIKSLGKLFLQHNEFILRKERNKKYNRFYSKYIVTSSKSYDTDTIENANKEFDLFITGSDQVWNLQLTDHDLNYFLQFAELTKRRCYAASFGSRDELNFSEERKKITELLMPFKHLLIREHSGIKILENLSPNLSNKAQVVCDPVFLLSKKQWINKLQLIESENTEENYILLFIVAPQTNAFKFADKLSEKHGYRIKYVNSYGRYDSCPKGYDNCMSVGPKELLNLILNAKIVITTSFHGMAFSINFNKEFYYELNYNKNARNDRLIQLADIFDLHDREIKDSTVHELNNINYVLINKKLELYSNESKSYLLDSL